MLKTLEVRCCCDPERVLGRITNPQLQKLGDKIRHRRAVMQGPPIWWGMIAAPWYPFINDDITLEVDTVLLGGKPQLAVKNQDHPLERLRLVPGFVAEAG